VTEPAGFVGPNDHWRYHTKLCIKFTSSGIHVVGGGSISTATACANAGGIWFAKTIWMVHVWTIPAYKNSRGVFSDLNPAIACSDGTYYLVRPTLRARYKNNQCRSNPSRTIASSPRFGVQRAGETLRRE
jgi:hypothetical protein